MVAGKFGKSLYGWRWQRYRMAQLQANPLCRFCFERGLIVPAVVVDHVVRHQGHDDPLFWDTANLQSLCKRCHDSIKEQLDARVGQEGTTSRACHCMVILNALQLKNNFLLAAVDKIEKMGGHFQPFLLPSRGRWPARKPKNARFGRALAECFT